MLKHIQHQSMEERVDGRERFMASFYNGKSPYQEHKFMASGDVQMKLSPEDSAIQLMAFQIHLAFGGSDLDNWLAAEEVLRPEPD